MAITRLHELDSQPAVTAGGRTLSYGELRGAAGALVARLDGVTRAAVWAENTLEAIIAMVATVESGIELVPINPKLGGAELGHVLSDARPEVVIGATERDVLTHALPIFHVHGLVLGIFGRCAAVVTSTIWTASPACSCPGRRGCRRVPSSGSASPPGNGSSSATG